MTRRTFLVSAGVGAAALVVGLRKGSAAALPATDATGSALPHARTYQSAADVRAAAKPINDASPAIIGTPKVGAVLTASPGTWS